MLSNHTSAWCCQVAMINEKSLRAMSLIDIFKIPYAGAVAQREITRWFLDQKREKKKRQKRIRDAYKKRTQR